MGVQRGGSPMLRLQPVFMLLCMLTALASLVLASGTHAHAEPDYPKLTGRVVDDAGILDPAMVAKLDAELAAQEAKTSDQLVVATVRSLDGRPIEDYANGLFRAWQLGQEKENNGILLLIAPNERKVRIEVGYGLEGVMTDAMASTIIRNAIIPEFKAGNMGEGAVKGTEAILEVLNMDPDEARARARALEDDQDSLTDDEVLDLILFLVFLAFILFLIWRSGGGRGGPGVRRRRTIDALAPGSVSTWDWGRGNSGGFGGGWSGGGGSSGGGGASGSW